MFQRLLSFGPAATIPEFRNRVLLFRHPADFQHRVFRLFKRSGGHGQEVNCDQLPEVLVLDRFGVHPALSTDYSGVVYILMGFIIVIN